MVNPNTIQAANSYLLSQSKEHDKSSLYVKKNSLPFVTISREAGAGGTTVGKKLVDYLNEIDPDSDFRWALFDKNLIERVIEDHNLPYAFRHFLSEEKVSELQNTFEQLMGIHPGISKLAGKTCSTIVNLASIGKVVIIGRGANFLTRNLPNGLHVRLIADHEWKVRHIEELFNLSRKEALSYIANEDIKRKEYVKKLFNRNVEDPLGYDLIIKTSSITFDEAVELISTRIIKHTHAEAGKEEVRMRA